MYHSFFFNNLLFADSQVVNFKQVQYVKRFCTKCKIWLNNKIKDLVVFFNVKRRKKGILVVSVDFFHWRRSMGTCTLYLIVKVLSIGIFYIGAVKL
jgi:hypothetical protein